MNCLICQNENPECIYCQSGLTFKPAKGSKLAKTLQDRYDYEQKIIDEDNHRLWECLKERATE